MKINPALTLGVQVAAAAFRGLKNISWFNRAIAGGCLPKWGTIGKQNRRGTPIVPGRLTANGKGYARLDNGALVVVVEPDQTREVKSRPKKYKRYKLQGYAEGRRLLNEACRQHRLTRRLQRRHALKHA